jgi:hypothetical protein
MTFIKENWFKFAVIIMFFLFMSTLTSGSIVIKHKVDADVVADAEIDLDGSVDSNYADIDGATIYNR